jgi:hypothetical protein
MKKISFKVTVDFAHVALVCDNQFTFSDIFRSLHEVSDKDLEKLCEETTIHNILSEMAGTVSRTP